MILNLSGLHRSLCTAIRVSTSSMLCVPSRSNYLRPLSTFNVHTLADVGQGGVCDRRLSPVYANHSFNRTIVSSCGHTLTTHRFNDSLGTKETDQNWMLMQKRYRGKKGRCAPSTKQLSFEFGGDQSMSVGTVDLTKPKLEFENIEELIDVDENVKKIFSLEFSTGQDVKKRLIHELLERVKDHDFDLDSLEVKIARYTIRIRNGIQHCLKYKTDKLNKSRLIKCMVRRRTLLKILKSQDIEKFNWLTNELKIKYVEPTKYDKWILSKRALRKKVARDAALALKKQKLAEFQKKLAEENIVFEKYRDAELAKIEKELKELGIDEMLTLEGTLEALNLSDMLPKPPKKIWRPRLIRDKKFELFGERKKILDDEILKANGFVTSKEMPYLP